MFPDPTNNDIVYLFTRNIMVWAFVPLMGANCCRFILYQVVKEKEINVMKTMQMMNVSSHIYGLSYIAIQ